MNATRLSRLMGVAYIATAVACADPSADTSDRVLDYLRADTYSRLVIEVDAVERLSLSPDVADPLLLAIEGLVDKPGGVELVLDERWASADEQRQWSFEDLEQRAESSFDLDVQPDEVKIHVMLLDGSLHDGNGDELLGLAWAHRHIALFQSGLREACTSGHGGHGLSSNACMSAELGVLAHEFGHVLGLVDNGVPMVDDHEDPDHPNHTEDPDCVMYWAYERRAVVTKIQDTIDAGLPPEQALGFCAPSLADIAAFKAVE